MPKTIDFYYQQRRNNFLFLRFFAALMVLFGHSFPIAAIPGLKDPIGVYIGHTYTGSIAVEMFFVISGFLITASYVNRNSLLRFTLNRVLRIFPALIVAVLVTACVLGPIVSRLSLFEYFTNSQVYKYIIVNIMLVKVEYFLPGVFESNPMKAVNGSLWTLPAEIRMYIWVALFGFSGLLKKRTVFNISVLIMVLIGVFKREWLPLIDHPAHYKLAIFFLAGSFFYMNRQTIWLNTTILFVMFLLCFLLYKTVVFPALMGGLVAYGTLWLAFIPRVDWYRGVGDYSYGLYIYAFPVQQTIKQYMTDIGPVALFISASFFTLILAMLSWHLVEKPASSLKKKDFSLTIPSCLKKQLAG